MQNQGKNLIFQHQNKSFTILSSKFALAIGIYAMRAYMLLGQDCFEIEENCIIFVLCTAIRIVLDSVGLI